MLDLTTMSLEDLGKQVEIKADTTIKWAMGAIECKIEELEEEKVKFDEGQDNRIKRLVLLGRELQWDEGTPMWGPARKLSLIGNTLDLCDEMLNDLEEERKYLREILGLTPDEPCADHRDFVLERAMADVKIMKSTLLTEPDDPSLME